MIALSIRSPSTGGGGRGGGGGGPDAHEELIRAGSALRIQRDPSVDIGDRIPTPIGRDSSTNPVNLHLSSQLGDEHIQVGAVGAIQDTQNSVTEIAYVIDACRYVIVSYGYLL